MLNSINGILLQAADKFYISYGSSEQRKIDNSVGFIKSNLNTYFGNKIIKIIEFRSYKRDTILPRTYDEHSDVDLMIVFNHGLLGLTPGTYRTQLLAFGNTKYKQSEVYKDSPTVVLELDHIKYDLVPAKEERYSLLFNPEYFIPQSDSLWMKTDPSGFYQRLTTANKAHKSNIKKLIRLLKSWNAMVGFPLPSFLLEQEIVNMSFWFCTSLEDYFFFAINNLSEYGRNATALAKIQALKANAQRVKNSLKDGNMLSALMWLNHILPN